MNDPGLEEPIQETSKKVEDERKVAAEVEWEDEQAFLNPRLPMATSRASVLFLLMISIVDGGSLLRHFHCSLYV